MIKLINASMKGNYDKNTTEEIVEIAGGEKYKAFYYEELPLLIS